MAIPESNFPRIGVEAVFDASGLRTRSPVSDKAAVFITNFGSATLGGRWYYWDPDSTTSDDGATVFKVVDITTGRWKLATIKIQDSSGFFATDDIESAAAQLAGVGGAAVVTIHRARGVVDSNVANLASFTVAGNDGLTYAAGERVALIGQSTGAQNGIYVVGTVDAGAAPLTRASDWAAAAVIPTGTMIAVDAGTVYGNRMLVVTNVGDVTVATTTPAFSSFLPDTLGGAIQKRTLTSDHTTLVAAAATETVNIGAVLPANARIVGVVIHTVTAFSGGSISAFTVDVGTAGDVDAVVALSNLFLAAVDGQAATRPLGINPDKLFASAGAQLIATFRATGGNVADATAGACTIDVLFTVLP